MILFSNHTSKQMLNKQQNCETCITSFVEGCSHTHIIIRPLLTRFKQVSEREKRGKTMSHLNVKDR